jgi:hypothetical protein
MLIIVEKIDNVNWDVKDQADQEISNVALRFGEVTEALK